MNQPGSFVIRIYGLILNENQEVLVTDEFQLGRPMTKFPGGGLHFGEGTIDCLIREIKEECNGQKIKKIRHFYTTDFFQEALFYPNHQLISIYYTAQLDGDPVFRLSAQPFDFAEMKDGNQSFRWIKIKELLPSEFSFPIDKLVAQKLKNLLPNL
ncbi:MAG TPA: NUDIX domain-containing protein [Prolixibacteraceae bacterium]|nr:NUDIX domain-containing protein [Prolixibacteraceae bacterium]